MHTDACIVIALVLDNNAEQWMSDVSPNKKRWPGKAARGLRRLRVLPTSSLLGIGANCTASSHCHSTYCAQYLHTSPLCLTYLSSLDISLDIFKLYFELFVMKNAPVRQLLSPSKLRPTIDYTDNIRLSTQDTQLTVRLIVSLSISIAE